MIAKTPEPPYYAVIFTTVLSDDIKGYAEMSDRMVEFVKMQEGFLGYESAREEIGITISYWDSLESIAKWRNHSEHTIAREKGISRWYSSFKTRVCKVERDNGFVKEV
ncbi:MAG: antibiotic biosynthesis monooxygenase [Bacteroidota bacterium]